MAGAGFFVCAISGEGAPLLRENPKILGSASRRARVKAVLESDAVPGTSRDCNSKISRRWNRTLSGQSMKEDRLSARSTFTCPSCAARTIGHFCGNCGEKEVTDQDYSLQHYLKEIVAAVTLLESKVFRSVWLLLTKPGYLSSEYFGGRRVRYMKPLQLFVFLNVVYYFSLSLFVATTFTTPTCHTATHEQLLS
jgi:Protein of unknown function (DUF3667)